MKFSINKSLEILENTPLVISSFLNNLSEEWTINNEGINTWSVKEVVAHLIVCEKTDWLPRVKIILSDFHNKDLDPINMKEHFDISNNSTLNDLILNFKHLRESVIKEIRSFNLQETDFKKTAIHPKLGEINLQELIAAWTVHDLTHITQISRIMAMQYKENVGGFASFLGILKA